jgi:hypothetical protein
MFRGGALWGLAVLKNEVSRPIVSSKAGSRFETLEVGSKSNVGWSGGGQ